MLWDLGCGGGGLLLVLPVYSGELEEGSVRSD